MKRLSRLLAFPVVLVFTAILNMDTISLWAREPFANSSLADTEQAMDELVAALEDAYADPEGAEAKLSQLNLSSVKLSQDARIPEAQRVELAALARHLEFAREDEGRIDDQSWERLERGLIADYPSQPDGYIGLLRVAESTVDAELANSLANELTATLCLPDWIRDRAESVRLRNDLIGLTLAELVGHAWPEIDTAFPTAIYTWSIDRAGEFPRLQGELSSIEQESGLELWGVCLDADFETANAFAMAYGLPGLQLESADETAALVAKRLCMNIPFLLYLTDSDGIVRRAAVLSETE